MFVFSVFASAVFLFLVRYCCVVYELPVLVGWPSFVQFDTTASGGCGLHANGTRASERATHSRPRTYSRLGCENRVGMLGTSCQVRVRIYFPLGVG